MFGVSHILQCNNVFFFFASRGYGYRYTILGLVNVLSYDDDPVPCIHFGR